MPDYLRDYKEANFHLVELLPNDKVPVNEGWRLQSATTINLETNNVGIQWGKSSNGLVDIDLDCPEAIALGKYLLPPTGAKFGRKSKRESHWLYFVRPIPEHFQGYKYVDPTDNSCIMEVRGDGNQTMVPPSIHPSGEPVEWDEYREVPPIEGKDLRLYAGRLASAVLVARQWSEGTRHDSALALAGALLRAGWTVEMIEQFVEAICDATGDSQFSDHRRAIRDTYQKWENGAKTSGWPKLVELWNSEIVSSIRVWLGLSSKPLYALTDLGNAERFFDQYEEKLAWVPDWKRWVFWNGKHWEVDGLIRVGAFASDSVKSIEREADYVTDPDYKSTIYKWAAASQSRARIDSMLELAKSQLAKASTDFDTFPNLLNVENGTIDLQTGEFSSHDREQYLTKMAPVQYDPDATCPIFEKTVLELVMGSQAVADYLQVSLGYSSTGMTSEDVFFILYGPGRNGKSTILETVGAILGDYAMTARAETFFEQSSIPSDLAMLVGARFVAAAETETGAKLSDNLVKRLTGGDKIMARFMYAEWFSFEPSFKIWLATNHKPTIATQSIAIWERVRLIPCENVIPRAKRDPMLRRHLRDIEPSGILNWLIAGAKQWYVNGLGNPPAEVLEATEGYRQEMNIIGDFVDEFCILEGETPVSKVYQEYAAWARENGRPTYGSRRFLAEMKEAGYPSKKSDGVNTFENLSLKERGVNHDNPFGSP